MKAEDVPVQLFRQLVVSACRGPAERLGFRSEGSAIEVAELDVEKTGGAEGAITLGKFPFMGREVTMFKLWGRRPTVEDYGSLIPAHVLTVRGRFLETGVWIYKLGNKFESDVDVEVDWKWSLVGENGRRVEKMVLFVGRVMALAVELARDVSVEVEWDGDGDDDDD